jgi:ABC-type nitrate/sulfonate/bicarbonate transport system permease component
VKLRLARYLPGAAVIALALAFVEIAPRIGLIKAVILPPTSEIARVLWRLIATGAFFEPMMHTLAVLFVAYFIACLAGISLGIAMGWFRPLYGLLEPLAEILRTIPKPVLLPPLMLFLGLGDPMKLFIVSLAAFFPVLINTVQAVRSVDPELIDTARTFGHGTTAILTRVVLPASAPLILAGMRVSLGIALVLVVLAEMLAGTGGLGQLILDMEHSFKVRETFAWLVILAVVGFALAMLFDWADRRIAFWNAPQEK